MLVPVTMYRSEKYAFRGKKCPGEKRGFFFRNFGCSRKVYNLYTAFYCDRLEEAGYRGGEKPPRITLPEVSSFKKDHPYLKEADSLALANAKLDFQEAVRRFEEHEDHVTYTKRAFRRDSSGTEPLSFRGLKGMPRFHAKARGYYSYTTNCQYPKEGNNLKRPTVRLEGDMLYLPKLKDGIRLRIHRPLPEGAVIKSVTVSMDTDGAFYASCGPEIHDFCVRDGLATLECSDAVSVGFYTLRRPLRRTAGEHVTHAECSLPEGIRYVRATVTDALGRRAWTNPIFLR